MEIEESSSKQKTNPDYSDQDVDEFKKELEKDEIYVAERHNTHLLRRFLKARRGKLPLSVTMLKESEAWRKSFKVDEIVREFVFPEFDKVNSEYKRYHHKTDKFGRPCYFEKLDFDLTKLLKLTTTERLMQHHVREYERYMNYKLVACSIKAGKNVDSGFTVLDLKGVSLSQFSSVRGIVNEISKISSDNYPETLGVMFIINAPMLFTAIWAVIKGWLDEQTVKKIHVIGSSYKAKLLEFVDEENLPVAYGGKCECVGGCGNSDVGPWSDGTVENYPKLDWEFGLTRDGNGFVSEEVKKLRK